MNRPKFFGYIAWLKFFSISLVVYGGQIAGSLSDFITAFSMPLFFFGSGYLFVDNKYSRKVRINNLIKRLIVPYFFIHSVMYPIWITVGKNYGIDAHLDIPWYKPLIGILYGSAVDNFMIHAVPLWFLPALFVTMLYYIFFIEGRTTKQKALLLLPIGLIAFAEYKLVPVHLPWGIDVGLTALIFFTLGNIIKNSKIAVKIYDYSVLALFSSLGLIALTYWLSTTNATVFTKSCHYNNYGIYLINAVTGLSSVFLLSIFLDKVFSVLKPIRFVSLNTLFIFGFNAVAYTVIKAVIVFVLKLPLDTVGGTNPFLDIFFLIIAYLLLTPGILFFNRFAPGLVGQKKLSKRTFI
jgi:hypothetical protein